MTENQALQMIANEIAGHASTQITLVNDVCNVLNIRLEGLGEKVDCVASALDDIRGTLDRQTQILADLSMIIRNK